MKEKHMDNCIFCKIATGAIPSDKVFENDEILAFRDIHPAAPVHVLIIPKQHIANLSECDDSHAGLLGRMLALVPKLAVQEACDIQSDSEGNLSGGYKTLINSGPDSRQEVYHLHVHMIGGSRPWRENI